MDIKQIMELCETFPKATSDYPFGEQPRCYRVAKKIFASVYPVGIPGAMRLLLDDETIAQEDIKPMVTLQCDAMYGELLRNQYPKLVFRPYHSPPAQQPYANTVFLDDSVPDELIIDMVNNAYDYVLHKLPKWLQKEILQKE